MAIQDLYPSFIQIHYRSAYAKHVATIPTRQWASAGFTHGYGGFTAWSGASIEADTMINAFLAVVTPFTDTGVSWDNAFIFNYPAPPPALPNPVTIIPLTAVGAASPTDADKALQSTYMFFDDAFDTMKLTFLDCDTTAVFDPQNYTALPTNKKALVDHILGDTHAFMSRGNGRPHIFRQLVQKYNNKLRRAYHDA